MINTWGLELDEFVDVPPGIAEDPWPGQGNPD
jgi:hypothetical protein